MHACREGRGMNIGKSIRADSLSALNTYSIYTGQGTEKNTQSLPLTYSGFSQGSRPQNQN